MSESPKKRTIYILLLRSGTIFSRIIGIFTRSVYTHSSVAFDPADGVFYSFARRGKYMPIPAGFIIEQIGKGVMSRFPDAPCLLYGVKVDEDVFEAAKLHIENILAAKKLPRYSFSGPILCWLGIQTEGRSSYFCSRFVAELLTNSGAIAPMKPASLYRPSDFMHQPEFFTVYSGPLSGLREHVCKTVPGLGAAVENAISNN